MVTFGIDLGTTFSAIAYQPETGSPVTLPLEGSEVTIPSAVLFRPGREIVVGKSALAESWQEGTKLVQFAKREIGLKGNQTWDYEDWTYHPEDISALVLRRIRDTVGSTPPGPVRDVVVSHPQYFWISQKDATKEACRLAGLNPVATISEPNAAAVSWGAYRPGGGPPSTVMVFDLGGGTFDVSIVRVSDRTFEFLANGGDARFGGVDWDEVLIDLARDEIRTLGDELDEICEPEQKVQLQLKAAEVKVNLSRSDQTRLVFEAGPHTVRMLVTRAAFEARSQHLVRQCVDTCRQVLEKSALEWKAIDRVLLVGSSTKMPMVQRAVEAEFGRKPDIAPNPKLDVVKGAAIWASWVEKGLVSSDAAQGPSLAPRVDTMLTVRRVTGLTNRGLGILALQPDGSRIVSGLIPGGTKTPIEVEEVYLTAGDQAMSIRVPVYEGDSENPDECVCIGEVCVDGLSRLPKGSEVHVSFKIDVAGALEATVTEASTGKGKAARLDRGQPQDGQSPASGGAHRSFDERCRHLESLRVLEG